MIQKHTRIENGYEIVESIYNGRKISQKRKIKTQQSSSIGFSLRRGKMKNEITSFTQYLDDNEEVEQEPQEESFVISNKTQEVSPK
jgi:hypothetical protein